MTTEEKVIKIVSEQMGCLEGNVTRQSTFVELGGDSLDSVEMVMELEDEFDIQIDDETANTMKTVGETIDYVKKHVK